MTRSVSRRFQREAEVLARLNHPHIAHIHGLERSDGTTALVMELVEGHTLADLVARGSLSLDDALPIAKQIAEALEAAHEQGIIHPRFETREHQGAARRPVKVLDFGLAKATEPAGVASHNVSSSPTMTTPAMTQAGVILGTAAYMSPEQARGKAVDRRADLWAFGCVLFEMLSGRAAFHGDTVTDVLAAVVKTEPEWGVLPADTPLPIRRLLVRIRAGEKARPEVAGRPQGSKGERFALKRRVLYLHTADGSARPTSRRAVRQLGVEATARNWRTLTTLLEMAKA